MSVFKDLQTKFNSASIIQQLIYINVVIFIITLILGILMTTTLHELNIENDPDCIPDSINDDFCNEETGAYMGRYHIAYKFKTDKEWEPISRWNYWMFLFFVPVLFTKAYPLGIAFVTACVLIFGIYDYLNDIIIQLMHGKKYSDINDMLRKEREGLSGF